MRSDFLSTDALAAEGEGPQVQRVPHGAARAAFIVDARRPGAWERVGGLPPAVRILFHLRENRLERGVLLLKGERRLNRYGRWLQGLQLRQVVSPDGPASVVLPLLDLAERFLYVDAAHLIDPRILARLCRASETTLAFAGPSDREGNKIRAAFLKREDLSVWLPGDASALIQQAGSFYPTDLDPFSKEVRGPAEPYFLELDSKEDAAKATRRLISSQQKHVMDFPAEFVDPPFENALTLLFCRTPLTPNAVTFMGAAAAAGAAWLFWNGLFLLGALTGFAIEVLDGVDGKLARTKLAFSRLGENEALVDYFGENGLYAALGAGMVRSGYGEVAALLAGLLIFSDTADNLFYTLAEKFHGKSIDLFSPFDAAFRRIAGRRNIYNFIFIVGFSLGFPIQTLAAASGWAALTAAMHGARLHLYGRRRKRRRENTTEEL